MNPAPYADKNPDKPAYIMAKTGQAVTYCELDERSNRAAQLFHSLGLRRGDHVAVCMENNVEYPIVIASTLRCGLYLTPISSRLTAPEVEYIINDCEAKVFVTSEALTDVAAGLVACCPNLAGRFMVGTPSDGYHSWSEALSAQPTTPVEETREGNLMLSSSGTTGRP